MSTIGSLASIPSLTAAQAAALNAGNPGSGGIAAGMPLSQLVPAEVSRTQDMLFDPTTGAPTPDAVQQQMLDAGLLQWTGDPSSRDSRLTIGPTWQANVPATTLQQGQFGGPAASFGGAAAVTPFTQTPSTLTGIGGNWSRSPQFGTPDPFSGIAKMIPGSGGGYQFQRENIFDRMGPGPIMGLMAGGFLGGPLMGSLGQLGAAGFNAAGQLVQGGRPNPLAFLGPILGQLGLPSWLAPLLGGGMNIARTGNPMAGLGSIGGLLRALGGSNG